MKHPLSVRILHWLIASLILGLLAVGLYMAPFDLERRELAFQLYYWHKSFGMLVLLLVIYRLINIRLNPPLALPAGLSRFDTLAARAGHRLLYGLMLVVPILGYIQTSAFENSSGVHFFFWDLPELIGHDETIFEITNALHKWCSFALIGVLVAHVAGAAKHRVIDRQNDVLGRML
jgi:cytochrome b561